MDASLSASALSIIEVLSNRVPKNPKPLQFSASTLIKVNYALDHAWADSTLLKYRSAVNQFIAFCDSENIPNHFRIPASEHLLCAFAASRVGLLAADTVQNHLAAIKAWHIYNDKPWRGGTRLHYILNGVANLTPSSSRKPPRPPITRSMLLLLASHLDLSSPFDACCLAAACLAMWAQARLGEILSNWETSFKPAFVVCRSHLLPPFNKNGSRKCHLPFSKVAKSRGEDICICRQLGPCDPIAAIDNHLLINHIPPNLPLFSYLSNRGWRCLTKKKLLLRCNSIWSLAGIPTTTGHSFRIGGTTELLLAGVPPDVVKALGRWSSDAFLRYWRSLELLAPLHIENLPAS
ncbi:hypothetical protein PAXINDRAFT_89979 [Paxillus involutus ATCC 200175]|uniref:DNA breaking-rejoining enzyme n=1 Tax=Paxillus involutus ATCC 200175 TaxID=664439 RepID=A0A0C9SNC9_PAXIN|nr:hypothetical protein PAXINDRAFT_89979 [Paxillus involutus ATCC 200175]